MSGVFKYDTDGKWRCGLNVTIINDQDEPIDIRWIHLNVTAVTFVDDTYKELNSPINDTRVFAMPAESNRTISYNLTEAGFDKEPKELHVDCLVSTNRGLLLWYQQIISEFPSLIILPLFMTAALIAAIMYKRKHKIKPVVASFIKEYQ